MAGENKIYVAWVRQQPCLEAANHDCFGPIEAHHAGPRAYGRRAHDNTCVPLCLLAHRNFHDACGLFRHLNKEQRRAWTAAAIALTRLRHEEDTGEVVGD